MNRRPHESDDLDLGVYAYSRNERVRLSTRDRGQHLHVIGQTGTGKTTFLKKLIAQDIAAGRGVGVIDPHGDLAEELLEYIPRSRTNDLSFFDAGDLDHPFALNPLEMVLPSHPRFREEQPLVASGVISVLKKLFRLDEGSAPRLLKILRNAVLAILDYPTYGLERSLLGLDRMLWDEAFQARIVRHVRDERVRSFWTEQLPQLSRDERARAVDAVSNKLDHLLVSPIIKSIVGRARSTVRPRQIMDKGRIAIFNLSKGRIGEDNAGLLGAVLVTRFQLAAMSRASLPVSQRRPFYLYVDEFQNFATDSFGEILSEARKYGLSLVLAHQYLEQLGNLAGAVRGNVPNRVCFRLGADDAETLAREFAPYFTPEELMSLPNTRAHMRLLQGQHPDRAWEVHI